MKRLVCITGMILISCLLAGTFFAPSTSVEASGDTQTHQTSGAREEDIYVLKTENSYLVVYKKGEGTPYITTDTLTDSLPQGDIKRLEKGIEIKGKTELRKAMEDYGS